MKTARVITEEHLVFDPLSDHFEQLTEYGDVSNIGYLEEGKNINDLKHSIFIKREYGNDITIKCDKEVLIIVEKLDEVKEIHVITRKEYNEKYTEII